jgi:HSP20 family protein
MALIPWRQKVRERGPAETSPLATLRGEIDRLFDSFVREPLGGIDWPFGSEGGWAPVVDIAEDEKEFTVRAEVPGLDPKDFDVTISGSHLVLAGEKKETTRKEGKNFYHTESRFGSFRRTIPLPDAVDPENVEAEYAHGVLYIHLKKLPSAVAKRIEVKAEKDRPGGGTPSEGE